MAGLPLLVSFPDEKSSISLLAHELEWSRTDAKLAARLYQRGLPPLVGTSCLPFLFGVSLRLMAAMEHRPIPTHYRIFAIPKRGGGVRTIEAPRRFLKTVQSWIYQHILFSQKLRSEVKGFVAGRGIFDHAKAHRKGRNLLVVDIRNFFPSIGVATVVGVYEQIGFPSPVANQLARLCCLEGRLPQGAPTSPMLANISFRPVDENLTTLAKKWDCKYTRYADDLAFSGVRRFSSRDIASVGKILRYHGFAINESKSRRIGAGGRQLVTGLVVNRKAHPVRWKRRLWRATFHRASKHPAEFSERISYLRGVAAFVNQYDAELAKEYGKIVDVVGAHRDS